ncbi:hypothetical protein ABZ883_14775 [Streptomyces sp. NPDC046977]|uniref:hypothetical protein n=1 Tax=Streptomyces sp. NPDC046977 TaxID=3154703 RepID=UPI0033C942D1
MTRTPIDNLTTVLRHWDDLHDMLTTTHGTTWPPAGRLRDHLAALTAAERDERAQRRADERADSTPDALGESPAPIRLQVLDTMRDVQQALVYCADTIAAAVQRPPMRPAPRGAGWTPAEIAQRDQLAANDADDPRRWTWPTLARGANGAVTRPYRDRLGGPPMARTAREAANWLILRLQGEPGPFVPLTALHREQIAQAARACAEQVQRAIDLVRDAHRLTEPCPGCRGQLLLHSGDGQPPAVQCADCGRTWTETETAA